MKDTSYDFGAFNGTQKITILTDVFYDSIDLLVNLLLAQIRHGI